MKKYRCKSAFHVPDHIVSQHADEYMGADTPVEAVPDGTYQHICAFHGAEYFFDTREILVLPYRFFRRQRVGFFAQSPRHQRQHPEETP